MFQHVATPHRSGFPPPSDGTARHRASVAEEQGPCVGLQRQICTDDPDLDQRLYGMLLIACMYIYIILQIII